MISNSTRVKAWYSSSNDRTRFAAKSFPSPQRVTRKTAAMVPLPSSWRTA